ncbi:MAG TPA: ABC transporter ATP-binding protein [Candidatus Avacidaminococcus intestinavium]|uniref:ABC transporter ATP-binding protein n=1 Tax=Candidatus Avacidaminococcus intestinavium TaxID=2840684 RepID=A0A9D1SK94_9FIRM|nr:ABC transporter ATP-binding protein [Candidatus Avacidaminococcus intestinavium]
MDVLEAQNISVHLAGTTILSDISLGIEQNKITSIIGPNGSGKSTLLKALARIIPCYQGAIFLDEKNIKTFSHKEIAQKIAILTQSPEAPADLTVKDLVELGRFPYRSWWKKETDDDQSSVEWALQQTNLLSFAGRIVNTLSGGERQRAWIAMALAQKPEVLLLDEPTTYLDIAHQLEVMLLLKKLNQETGLTVVMVLHDLNHAFQFSDNIAVIKEGHLWASGNTSATITEELLKEVFKVQVDILAASNGKTSLLPVGLEK